MSRYDDLRRMHLAGKLRFAAGYAAGLAFAVYIILKNLLTGRSPVMK